VGTGGTGAAAATSGGSTGSGAAESGGAPGSGGSPGSGGAAESSGTAGTGGATSGGSTGSGGAAESGGAPGGGGTPGSGGSGTGGAPTTGCNDGDYYVALDGNDTNPGTMEQPFATLQAAIEEAEAGDLVYVRGGVYEIVDLASSNAGVLFWRSGTSASERIRYFACPGELPVFDFSRMNIEPDPEHTTGFVISGSWLHLKGFEVRNVPMNTRSNTGVGLVDDSHHVIIEQFDIHHNFGPGLFVSHTMGGHEIINCDSHDNYDPYSNAGDGENADGFGVHYQDGGPSTIIRGCRAWWNSDDGYDFINQEYPVTIENSWAMGSGYIHEGTGTAGNGNGFKIGSSKTGIRHVVRNCVAWGNRANGFYANHSTGGNDWFNNTSYDNGTQYSMLASTWDAEGNRTDGVILTGPLAHLMRNNIGHPNDNAYMEGVDSQFNSWDLGLTPSDSDFVSVSDQGFMGPRNPDGSLPNLEFLRLREDSQMIDRGTDVGLPYNGSAPDLGAYEN
jgi:hypothetical protein